MQPTIRLNDNNVAVQVAQLLTGYVPDTGSFNAEFETHVKDWQTAHGLTADGIIGEGTWTAIAKAAPVVSRKVNKKSVWAKAVQLLVGADADGIFGNKTAAKVKEQQTANGLSADGIVGQMTWTALIVGSAEKGDCPNIQPPDFKQYDSRWASKMYSNHGDKSQTMKSSACGPTSMADIVAQWWDANITPYDLAKLSMEWGTRTYNSGTSSTFFRKIAAKYNASKYTTASGIDAVKNCLDAGGYVIVCFGKGTSGKAGYNKWTTGGHYCCIWGYSGDTFYINDPASAKAARAKGTKTEVLNCRKGFYLFWR